MTNEAEHRRRVEALEEAFEASYDGIQNKKGKKCKYILQYESTWCIIEVKGNKCKKWK